jgi:membrane-associated protein
METLIDLFLNLDDHLTRLVASYGRWIYALLFAVVFAETGLVVTPLLPGDSLLFAAGALAATGALDVRLLLVLLTVAAILGDAVNYAVGRRLGPMVFHAEQGTSLLTRLLNRRHLERSHEFFERHGGKAIVLARFVPIVRTFVPFVAGASAMSYGYFALYNVVGGILWVVTCTMAGFAFGNIPIVKDNFSLVALAIVALSLVPVAVELVRERRRSRGPDAIDATGNRKGHL